MQNLIDVMSPMLTNPYYQKPGEINDLLCRICRAVLDDDYYEAVHILSDALKKIVPVCGYIREWQIRLHNDLSKLSTAISDIFVSRMESVYGIY